MVKLAYFFMFFLCACASVPLRTPRSSTAVPLSSWSRLWTKKLNGFISDLSFSKNGEKILVATVPNYESDQGDREYLLSLFDSKGKQLWKMRNTGPVKAQALSDDGSWAVVGTYDDRLTAISWEGLGQKGFQGPRTLWSVNATCRPTILNLSKKVICYHDDDADPRVAFDVFDGSGKKLFSYPIGQDILGLKVSQNQRYFAVGLSRGQVILFDDQIRSLWQVEVPGEVVDLDISSNEGQPHVAVLFHQNEYRISLYDAQGKVEAQGAVPFPSRQVDLSQNSLQNSPRMIWAQGLTKESRFQGLFSAQSDLKHLWKVEEPLNVDSPLPSLVMKSSVLVQSDAYSFVEFDFAGAARAILPVSSEGHGNLYLMAYSPETQTVVFATDEGEVVVFRSPSN